MTKDINEPYTATPDELTRWIEALRISTYPASEVYHMVNSETLPCDDENKRDLSVYLLGIEGMTRKQLIKHLKKFIK